MIRINVTKKSGSYVDFESAGHAGAGEEGHDIVCAAVSALIINAVNSIERFTDDAFTEESKDGYVRIRFDGPNSPGARLLMDSLVFGLEQIREDCRDYLKVHVREV
ncbi:MAG: ribosomal-processing cysteine protease Prp [Blautia sp.]|nr:ribosomal-processing cysteine protease Prp [Blautia sp.]